MTLKHVSLVELLSVFYLFSTQDAGVYSRSVFYLTGIIYAALTYSVRLVWKKFLKERTNDRGKRSLLIITTDSLAEECVRRIRESSYGAYRLAGLVLFDREKKGSVIGGVPVVSNRTELLEYICREWIDEVFVNLPEEIPHPTGLLKSLAEMGVVSHVKLTEEREFIGKKQFVENMGSYTVMTASINYATPVQLLMKRMLDICGGLVGCLITGVLLLFVGPAIYIQSPGPVFFSQIRVGKNGKKFKMYKFRSMYPDAEKRKEEVMKNNRVSGGFMYKLDYDPRIIGSRNGKNCGVGNFIRKTSIDEFPQFWNVLKGDMSLVGTRPPTVDEWEKYELHHRARLAIKPGLTGMWQVSGRSDITDFEEVVKLDKTYIENWTFGLDIRMLLKTLYVVTAGKGSM